MGRRGGHRVLTSLPAVGTFLRAEVCPSVGVLYFEQVGTLVHYLCFAFRNASAVAGQLVACSWSVDTCKLQMRQVVATAGSRLSIRRDFAASGAKLANAAGAGPAQQYGSGW